MIENPNKPLYDNLGDQCSDVIRTLKNLEKILEISSHGSGASPAALQSAFDNYSNHLMKAFDAASRTTQRMRESENPQKPVFGVPIQAVVCVDENFSPDETVQSLQNSAKEKETMINSHQNSIDSFLKKLDELNKEDDIPNSQL